MKVRKRSAVCDAVQWQGGEAEAAAACAWLAERSRRAAYVVATDTQAEALFVESEISGAQTVTAPAWFVSDDGRIRVLSDAEFEAQYEAIG